MKPAEFATLTQNEKTRYLDQAIEAIKDGHPMDDLPDMERS